jgi:transcriptional regulator with XRE-family HTH domain
MTIKELRTAAGMTQKAFSEYFGIPKRTIEDWESEKPTAKTARCQPYVIALIEYKLRKEGMIPDAPDLS